MIPRDISLFLRALVGFIFGLVEFIIGLRILLKLFGANPNAGFVEWVYEISQPLLAPFLGMFPSPQIESFVIEFSALFGLVVYAFVGYLLTELIRYVSYTSERYYKRK